MKLSQNVRHLKAYIKIGNIFQLKKHKLELLFEGMPSPAAAGMSAQPAASHLAVSGATLYCTTISLQTPVNIPQSCMA